MAKPHPTEPAVETAPAPKDGNTSLAEALLEALARLQPPAPVGLSADQLQEVLAHNAQATRKALRPENERHPDVSAFNPEGERDHPRPKLARKAFFAGIELKEDELTRAEIELLNRFSHACHARNGQWKAEIRDGALLLSVPAATTDDRMDLPNGLSLILRELLGGEKAVDAESLAQRVAELEAKLAAA